MDAIKVKAYSLYQTFSRNNPEKDLSVTEKKKLAADIPNLGNDEKVAFLRLILEHARVENQEAPPDSLPYKGELTDDGPVFDIGNLPRDLRWILLKFVKVCKG